MTDQKIQFIIEALNRTDREFAVLKQQLKNVNEEVRTSGGFWRRLTSDADSFKLKAGEIQGALQSLFGAFLLYRGISFLKSSIDEAEKAQNSIRGLGAVARYNGVEIGTAMQAASKLAADGLVDITDVSKALQNLLQRGFNLDEAVAMLERLKDSAAFNRQASLSMSQAVVSATEGLKNENSILVDNAGVTKNVSIMWKEYASQIGKSVTELTIAEKRQAEYNGIMAETEAQLGNAKLATEGLTGAKAKLNVEVQKLQRSLGDTLAPAFLEIAKAINWTLHNAVIPFIGGIEILSTKIAAFSEKINLQKELRALEGGPLLSWRESKKEYAERQERIRQIKEQIAELGKSRDKQIKEIIDKWSGELSLPKLGADTEKRRREAPGGAEDTKIKALKDKWADTLRDIDADIAKKGLPEFEQKMIDIANKWAKLKEQFKDIPGSGNKIAAGQETEEKEAIDKWHLDYQARQIKASEETRKQADATEESIQKGLKETTEETKKDYAERRAAREAEINSQLAELDIAEKAGTFHRDTIKERIRLEEERLAGQQADLAMMAKQADPTAWYAQSAAIDATRLKIIGLKDELIPVQARLRQFADQATDLWKNVGDALQRTFDNMNETLVEFTMTGKLNFTDFANSVIRDLLRILYYQSITGPLAMGINGWIQGLSGGGAGASPGTGGVPTYITHTGGVMGEAGLSYRIVPAFAFAGAPRFHGGFAPDEYPAVLQRGEGVFTAGQMKALGALINGDAAPARAIENHYATTVQMTINALDSRSVSQTLAQHQAEIVGIVNLAYNKRGQRGPLGS